MKKILFVALLSLISLPASLIFSASAFAGLSFDHGGFDALGRGTIHFGTVPVRSTSTRYLRITNTGTEPTNLRISGGSFEFRAYTNCPAVLPVAARCTVRIDFRPTSPNRSYYSTLRVHSDATTGIFSLHGWSR